CRSNSPEGAGVSATRSATPRCASACVKRSTRSPCKHSRRTNGRKPEVRHEKRIFVIYNCGCHGGLSGGYMGICLRRGDGAASTNGMGGLDRRGHCDAGGDLQQHLVLGRG